MDTFYNTFTEKEDLLKIVLGDFHMDNYYDNWINTKMDDFKTFYSHLDNMHKKIYDTLNDKCIKKKWKDYVKVKKG